MAEGASFADFVKDAREKKKNEALAQQFLGSRGRKPNAPGAGAGNARAKQEKPNLLSRMSGVQKRSSSAKPAATANIDGKWQHDLHKLNNPNGPPKKLSRTASASQIDRNTRTYDKFASSLGPNTRNTRPSNDTAQLSIKGAASNGPFTLIASNFAAGTTAADIESVMGQIGGDLLSCRVVVPTPTVMAELTFATRDGADNVIATFNNKKADGKVLYVYYKSGPSSAPAPVHTRPSNGRLAPPPSHDEMDVDTNGGARAGSFNDGRYGFNENGRRQPPSGPRRRY
ncbi:hypothetical protein K458DRAFT_408887 [Lentithecium fluviatile CBS 122367]|uniref:RRM domain-containing protein n=1 Tax=Lentithecium fluviatile CBS 122367 TaxID=1168545 RepID=A0A6G1IJH2_9PLEO|nr:hypothetical protein K458DRAFT_408887 [Lentithecium fluviatile CBS 122367]